MTPEIDQQIAREWPVEWAKANVPHPNASKRRNNLRRRWKLSQELAQFKAANPAARCETCRNWKPMPVSRAAERHCALESDFHGYAITKAESVCVHWQRG